MKEEDKQSLMQSDEYDEGYFKETRNNVGLLLKKMRPLWWRWARIIRKHKSSGRLLDVGCGEGYFLEYVERHYDVYGVDVSEYCIREARHRTNRAKLSIGSITYMDYEDESFDVITCFDVLEHLENPEMAIQECRRVLKSGGVLVTRVPNTSSLGCKCKKEEWFGYRDTTHASLLSNEEWFEVLQKSNFKILNVFYDGMWDTPYSKYIPRLIQDCLIKFPSLILFLFGVKFPQKYGENLCIITCGV